MASPVDTSVKWARSTMPGAPVLTRAAGSLIALLDALLVNGWGLQTATSVAVADGIATATFSMDHAAAPHAVVLVAGATGDWTDLNGEQKVTAIEPNKIKWATTLPDGTAAGTITVKMAAAGFDKPFSGTNLAAYKSAHPYAHGQFLRVNDTTASYARAVGYENMTAISTGTGLFPSAAQVSGGYWWGKNSAGSGTTAVPYSFASDGRAFYLLPQAAAEEYAQPGSSFATLAFGDMVPESPSGDPFATILAGSANSDWVNVGGGYFFNYAATDAHLALPRAFSGTGTAVRGLSMCELNVDNTGGSAAIALPNPITGAIPMGRVLYKDPGAFFARAAWPGAYYAPVGYVERYVAPGAILEMADGRAMLGNIVGGTISQTSNCAGLFIDITGPWR